MTPVRHLEPRISPRIFEKIRIGRNGILRCSEELIHENNQKSKISWHCPFKDVLFLFFSDGVNKSETLFNASEMAALFHPSYTHPEKPTDDEAPLLPHSANQSAPLYPAAYQPENPTNQQTPPYAIKMQTANHDAQLHTRPVKSTNQEVPLVNRPEKPTNLGASMYTRPEKTANQGVPLYIPFYIKPRKSANKRAHSVDLSFTHDAPPTNTREQMILLAKQRHDLDGKHQLRLLHNFFV
jgi:hypothetical protein